MDNFFDSDTLKSTGFSKMRDTKAIEDRIEQILEEAEKSYDKLKEHRLAYHDLNKLKELCDKFRVEITAIKFYAQHVLDDLADHSHPLEIDKLMLDFVISKAWGVHHAVYRMADNWTFDKSDKHKAF